MDYLNCFTYFCPKSLALNLNDNGSCSRSTASIIAVMDYLVNRLPNVSYHKSQQKRAGLHTHTHKKSQTRFTSVFRMRISRSIYRDTFTYYKMQMSCALRAQQKGAADSPPPTHRWRSQFRSTRGFRQSTLINEMPLHTHCTSPAP